MERYENILKIEEIRKLTDENQYSKALKILDSMDYNKIKSLTDLSIIAEVLSKNDRYDEAMDVLTRIYSKNNSRRILYQLVDVSIRSKDIKQAEEFLELYQEAAPDDFYQFIFRYCIDKLKGEPIEILIESLEELKEYEYIENWAYELAKLYHKAGMKDKCVRECSDIILWFGDGIYVEKAKLLKGYYVGDINPVHMLKTKDRLEAEKRLGLDKTKDYSEMKSQIDQYLQEQDSGMDLGIVAESNSIREANYVEEDNSYLIKQKSDSYHAEESQDITYNKEMDYSEEVEVKRIGQSDQEAEPDYNEEALQEKEQYEKLNQELYQGYNQEQNENFDQELESIQAINMDDKQKKDVDYVQEQNGESNQKQKEQTSQNSYITTVQLQDENVLTDNKDHEQEQTKDYEQEHNGQSSQVKQDNLVQESNKLEQISAETGIDFYKIFGYFSYMNHCSKQIEQCLENLLTVHTNNNHFIITGSRKSGKTTAAKKLAKACYCLGKIKTTHVAKIEAEKFNGIIIDQKKDILKDGTLIIEQAGKLNRDGIEHLLWLIDCLDGHIIIILEEEESETRKLLHKYPELSNIMQNQIDIPAITVQDLYGFVYFYITDQDYQLTEDANAILLRTLEEINDSVPAEECLETAMQLAKKVKSAADDRNKKMLTKLLGTRNLNPTDFQLILAEDF